MAVAAAVVGILAFASWNVVMATRGGEDKVLPIGLPEWISLLVMPAALGIAAVVFAWKASEHWAGRLAALAAKPSTWTSIVLGCSRIACSIARAANTDPPGLLTRK